MVHVPNMVLLRTGVLPYVCLRSSQYQRFIGQFRDDRESQLIRGQFVGSDDIRQKYGLEYIVGSFLRWHICGRCQRTMR